MVLFFCKCINVSVPQHRRIPVREFLDVLPVAEGFSDAGIFFIVSAPLSQIVPNVFALEITALGNHLPKLSVLVHANAAGGKIGAVEFFAVGDLENVFQTGVVDNIEVFQLGKLSEWGRVLDFVVLDLDVIQVFQLRQGRSVADGIVRENQRMQVLQIGNFA